MVKKTSKSAEGHGVVADGAAVRSAPSSSVPPTPATSRGIQEKDLDWIFSHHDPSEDQVDRYNEIREKAKELARVILALCPPCADRTAAIRKVREAVMTANASIALHGTV